MKIIFFGSDDFAAVHLKQLIEQRFEVVGCVTPPDKPKGRHLHVSACPVEAAALAAGLPILQPADISDPKFIETLRAFAADIFVVIAYGKILPPEILAIPKLFCLNVHASLLPRYRGAAPINWAIINGEEKTGVSIIKLNAKIDAGDILAQQKMPIRQQDTSVTLRAALARAGSALLCRTLDDIAAGRFTLHTQDISLISLAPKLKKAIGNIDFNKSAEEIHNLTRGLVPWPSAYTFYQGRLLKILATRVVPLLNTSASPGEIVELTHEGFVVATGAGGLFVERVHLESAKAMDATSFVAGHKVQLGMKLGR
jgi:methionyl-tRNA formyltransferase